MTKNVRIENADTSDHPIRVEVWERTAEGREILVNREVLYSPTAMTTIPIHQDRWLKVSEVPAEENVPDTEVGPGMP